MIERRGKGSCDVEEELENRIRYFVGAFTA